MNLFFDSLESRSLKINSRLCVGLDPRMEKISAPYSKEDDPVFAFNKMIIDETSDFACCYKPNFAFYEALGIKGLEALQKTIAYIPDDIPVIADAKRGDIGSTAEAYAKAIFDEFKCDGVTLNPLLGHDSMEPFLKRKDNGLYILCLTSNPGSRDFQRQDNLYRKIAEKIQLWNEAGNCGMVVGATQPEHLKEIRQIAPDIPLLLPGIGSQGGDLEGTVSAAADSKGGGFIINVSRGISQPPGEADIRERVRQAAKKYRDAINSVMEK